MVSHCLRSFFTICTGILLIWTSPVTAADSLDLMAEDFQPVSGFVVMQIEGEYLIDLDAADGISVGDLFAVVEPGEKVVHPMTKEVLGTLDRTKGILKVTRIKSGYSYAKPLQGAGHIEKGDTIRRYANMRAVFRDLTGEGEALFARTKSALPSLEWQDFQSASAESSALAPPDQVESDLFFVLTAEGMEVRDQEYRIIKSYPLPGYSRMSRAPAVPSPQVAPAVPPPAVQFEVPRTPSAGAKVVYQPSFSQAEKGNDLPAPVVMSDFIQDDNRLLLATTDGSEIRVFRIDGGITEIARGDTSGAPDILAVHWWRQSPDAELRLAVTALDEQNLESAVFALQNDTLVSLAERIPYILGAFDLNGDEAPELLLGQSFDLENFFGYQIFEIQLAGKSFKASNPGIALPRDFTVQGSTFVDLDGDGQMETVFIHNNRLNIYKDQTLLFQSPGDIGGTLAVAAYETTPVPDVSQMIYAAMEVPPVAVDLDSDGVKELVAIASERSMFASPGLNPSIRKSWLAVIDFQEGSFALGRIGEDLQIPLQGLAASSSEILFIPTKSGSLLGKKGSSSLLRLPLTE